jgi:hypothetical protein
MPRPCHSPTVSCPSWKSALWREISELLVYSLTDWFASDNNVRGIPRGSRKKPNAGSSPTCRLWTADTNSHMRCQCRTHAALWVALRSRFQNGMVVARHECGTGAAWAWHGIGMACVNQTRPHSVNQIRKTQSKPLLARHGRGTVWTRCGNGKVCVN